MTLQIYTFYWQDNLLSIQLSLLYEKFGNSTNSMACTLSGKGVKRKLEQDAILVLC